MTGNVSSTFYASTSDGNARNRKTNLGACTARGNWAVGDFDVSGSHPRFCEWISMVIQQSSPRRTTRGVNLSRLGMKGCASRTTTEALAPRGCRAKVCGLLFYPSHEDRGMRARALSFETRVQVSFATSLKFVDELTMSQFVGT